MAALPETIHTDVLVVGGGTGGTAAAIQSARRGVKTVLVSEFTWLGGMLTSAGVSAPDGNELAAFQTGIWGAFLQALAQRQPGGLANAWVSLFTYEPRIGAQIFADWVKALPNLQWIAGYRPKAVLREGDRIIGVAFDEFTVRAQITLDGTELGDLLALGNIPCRWGWEFYDQWQEPSAPRTTNAITSTYPVQSPTWVCVLQDVGSGNIAPLIPQPPNYQPELYVGAWEQHGVESFLNYGRLPGDRFMLNWPLKGNDYGHGIERLLGSDAERQAFLQEAHWHSLGFAHFIQTELGRRYGLALDTFPMPPAQIPTNLGAKPSLNLGGGAFALHPYYRESRRLIGLATVREQDILPVDGETAAALPINSQGQVTAIAFGNYPNDHHYPGYEFALQPKSIQWGGRWTGTPFTLPYSCLVPESVDGFLACEKNSSISHIANGATRLQPVVLLLGQASGMAAALCVEHQCEPRQLPLRSLQAALLNDSVAPAQMIPFLNNDCYGTKDNDLEQQRTVLDQPNLYLSSDLTGESQSKLQAAAQMSLFPFNPEKFLGTFSCRSNQFYFLECIFPEHFSGQKLQLVTIYSHIHEELKAFIEGDSIALRGSFNDAGNWLLVCEIMHGH